MADTVSGSSPAAAKRASRWLSDQTNGPVSPGTRSSPTRGRFKAFRPGSVKQSRAEGCYSSIRLLHVERAADDGGPPHGRCDSEARPRASPGSVRPDRAEEAHGGGASGEAPDPYERPGVRRLDDRVVPRVDGDVSGAVGEWLDDDEVARLELRGVEPGERRELQRRIVRQHDAQLCVDELREAGAVEARHR